MTQGFDEWFKKRHTKSGLYEKTLLNDDDALYLKHEMRKAYLKGAASRQAEIDELQNRIENVLNTIEPSDEISHMLYREVYKILKGESNEV